MSRHFTPEEIRVRADVTGAPNSVGTDRAFGLPRRLYVATVGLYFAFIAILGYGLSTPGLMVPLAISAIIITAGFGVPMLWTRMKPDHLGRAPAWARFEDEGIMTLTGPVCAFDAAVQVLILPILICLWALVIVVIASAS